nr:MAG TPA: hypothetical protein [Caudoviricetes sp.]
MIFCFCRPIIQISLYLFFITSIFYPLKPSNTLASALP